MKKLITVCWSVTIEAEVPDGATVESINNAHDLENEIVRKASASINWKDGMVTDAQDVENDETEKFTYKITNCVGRVIHNGETRDRFNIDERPAQMCSPTDLIGLGEYLKEKGLARSGDLIDFPENGVDWTIE